MAYFIGNKTEAAQFVSEEILRSKQDSQLTMIIAQVRSGVYSVNTATDMSSEDIVKMLGQACYDQLTSI